MPKTEIKSSQIKDAEVKRDDLNITTTGQAVVRKIIAGTNVSISSTGVDAGTGDVTINATAATGITSINSQTGSSQSLVTGTTGSDFNIGSTGNTHTFNIPDASGSNRGLVTIGSQSFSGLKTFSSGLSLGANSDAGGFRITNLGAPTSTTDAARLLDCQEAAAGFDIKDPVLVATTTNITLSGTQTIDGVALSIGDRVLVKDQTTASQNGIYVVASGSWTRATDADNTPNSEVTYGMFCFVTSGTTNGQTQWVLITSGTIVLGTTSLSFTRFGVGLGIATLNSLSVDSQTFATGSAGTDFGISSSGSTHTFNIPDASVSNRGLITTGPQTIAGAKTLTGVLTSVGIQPTVNNTSNIGSTSLAYASIFARNISSDTSQDLSLQTGGTTRWRVSNTGTLTNPQSGISAIQWSASNSVGRIVGASDDTGRIQIASASLPDNTLGPYIDMTASTGACSIVGKIGSGIVLNTNGGNTLTANSNGTVSINTTNNSDILNIQNNSPDQGITINGVGSGNRATLTLKSSGTTQASIGCDNGGFVTGYSGSLICSSTSGVVFFTNSANRWVLDSSGHLIPYSNVTYDIGSGTNACRVVYTRNVISDSGQNLGIEGKSEVYFYSGGSSSIRWAFTSGGHLVPILNQGYNIGIGGSNAVGSIFAVNYFGPSDIQRKREIENLPYGLDAIMAITPIKYKYKKFHTKIEDDVEVEDFDNEDEECAHDAQVCLGCSAQEIMDIIPEAVSGSKEDLSLCIDYTKLVPVLIKAIQELKVDNEDLRRLIEKTK
jgi:hypothetical protein